MGGIVNGERQSVFPVYKPAFLYSVSEKSLVCLDTTKK